MSPHSYTSDRYEMVRESPSDLTSKQIEQSEIETVIENECGNEYPEFLF